HVAVAERAGDRLSAAQLAICESCNIIARGLDESILGGNKARLDPRRLTWPRCIADRVLHEQLRRCVTGLGSADSDFAVIPREESFITAAESEPAALASFCIDEQDFITRFPRMVIGWRGSGAPVHLAEVLDHPAIASVAPITAVQPLWINETLADEVDFAADDMAVDNRVYPRFEHGCSSELPCPSVAAIRSALALGGCVAVVGGGLLGLEKFLDVACQAAALAPRALVMHAALSEVQQWGQDAPDAAESGAALWQSRVLLLERFGLPPLVALESERQDESEAREVASLLATYGVRCAPYVMATREDEEDDLAELTRAVSTAVEEMRPLMRLIGLGHSARGQLHDLANVIFGASVEFSPTVEGQLTRLEQMSADYLPVVLDTVENELPDVLSQGGAATYQMSVVYATSTEWRAAAGYLKVVLRKMERGF
ncbi:MAG: formate--tetrahydrofolate ligase, partial [Armatimonadota bacterium]|nr:formate--tetrahydrofolate ligase [Armatimonadota bacterium]